MALTLNTKFGGQKQFHIADLQDIPDMQRGWQFLVHIARYGNSLKGSLFEEFTKPQGANKPSMLGLRLKTVALPDKTTQPIIVNYQGMQKAFPGKAKFAYTFTWNFDETVNAETIRVFKDWMEKCNFSNKGNAAGSFAAADVFSRELTCDFWIYTLNASGKPNLSAVHQFYNAWPITVDGPNMDQNAEDAIKRALTFQYDWSDVSPQNEP